MIKLNKNGFTLIELLAVITIIGILMLLAIPSVSSIIENSRSDTFVTNAKTYTNAAKKLWTSDSLYCGSEPKLSSSVVDGDYYILIDTTDETLFPLLESGGKSPWGNRDVKGYVRISKSEDGKKTKYYIALTDGIHAIYDDKDNPVEVDLIKRQDVIRDITADVDKLKNIETIPFERGKYTTCSEESLTWTGIPIKVISGNGMSSGNEVCVDEECFYVMSSDENNVKLISKYNLYVGYSYDGSNYTPLNYNVVKQSSLARGYYGEFPYVGVIKYSETPYWGEIPSTYPGIYVYNSNSLLYSYVQEYKAYLSGLGLQVIEARLGDYQELSDFRSCCTNQFHFTSFWTGCAYRKGDIWDGNGKSRTFSPGYSETKYLTDNRFGIRPIIIVPKSQINS